MKKAVIRLSVLLLVFSISVSVKRNITEKDLFDFTWVGDPQVSPDGSTVVFVKVAVSSQDKLRHIVWTVPANGSEEPRRITSGNRDSTTMVA